MENKDPIRVIICGDRNYQQADKIIAFVKSLPEGTTLIEGEAKGADSIARDAAIACGFDKNHILKFPADWGRFGLYAGPLRNKVMLLQGKPTHVVAFHDNIEGSKGTKHMIGIAEQRNVPVFINPLNWSDIEKNQNT